MLFKALLPGNYKLQGNSSIDLKIVATLAIVRNIYNINSECDVGLLLKEASCLKKLEPNIYVEDFKKGPGYHFIQFFVKKSRMLGGMPGKQVVHVSSSSAHREEPSTKQPCAHRRLPLA